MKAKKRTKSGESRMFITPQDKEVQRALDRFWYTYYSKPISTEKRNRLAEQFAEEWLDSSKIKTDKPFIRHPATKIRALERSYTVGEVLADFIMRVDQVAERMAEYPVANQDSNVNGANKRKQVERAIFFQEDEDIAEEKDDTRVPAYSVRESEIILDNSIEDILFAETTPTVERFRGELRKVKKYAEFYATSFAEDYGYPKQEALRRIKRLDLSRVRECEICSGAFYPTDLRQRYCDCQQNPDEKLSTCQRIAKQIGDLMRNKSII